MLKNNKLREKNFLSPFNRVWTKEHLDEGTPVSRHIFFNQNIDFYPSRKKYEYVYNSSTRKKLLETARLLFVWFLIFIIFRVELIFFLLTLNEHKGF